MKTKKVVVLILTVLILGVFIMNLIYKPSSSNVYQVVSMIKDDEVLVMNDENMSLRVTKSGFKLFSKSDGGLEFESLKEGDHLPFHWTLLVDDNIFFGRMLEIVKGSEVDWMMTRYKVKYKDGVWPFNSDKLKVQLLDPLDLEVRMEINCKKR